MTAYTWASMVPCTHSLNNTISFNICFIVTFIHSSMRLRNVKNKLVNKMEVIGLKRTPMGLFLDAMGMDQELLS